MFASDGVDGFAHLAPLKGRHDCMEVEETPSA